MTFVITGTCCNDASCVPVCPVDCIRSAEIDTAAQTMLFIDPRTCVDCGACMSECPVGAIYYEDDLPAGQEAFRRINAEFFQRYPLETRAAAPLRPSVNVERGTLRIAIVGAGPAGCYAATELMRSSGIEISLIDRLPTPFGLIRAGVAPDHQTTKNIVSVFQSALALVDVRCYFNVTVGRDISHDELLEFHHAVIYSVGASSSRELGIPGEHLQGSHAAADFVGWFNGHPDHVGDEFNLRSSRAVIIGNGNVALDVARVLLSNPASLAATDIADHALFALADSAVEEVLIIGRRQVAEAAFSVGEFLALGDLPGVDVIVDGPLGHRPSEDFDGAQKYDAAVEYASRPLRAGNKRLVLRFGTVPVAIVGSARVQGLRVAETTAGSGGPTELIGTGLVLRSIGYRGAEIPNVPYDPERGVIPNDGGRIIRDGQPLPGGYTTGWIKRGPRGGLGTNRRCALETLTALFADFERGALATPVAGTREFAALLASRGVQTVDWAGWSRIDDAERRNGSAHSQPRTKLVTVYDLLAVAKP